MLDMTYSLFSCRVPILNLSPITSVSPELKKNANLTGLLIVLFAVCACRGGDHHEYLIDLYFKNCSVLIAIALLWHTVFPINKKLWTGSFVLLTVGIDCILLVSLIYITDYLQRTRGTYFFQVFGKNPLFIYLLSELDATLLWFFRIGEKKQPLYSWLYQNIYQHAGAYFGSFLFAVSVMLVCWLVGYWLDKRKIYVRV